MRKTKPQVIKTAPSKAGKYFMIKNSLGWELVVIFFEKLKRYIGLLLLIEWNGRKKNNWPTRTSITYIGISYVTKMRPWLPLGFPLLVSWSQIKHANVPIKDAKK